MALFNYATKEITLKVVYYGPGLCGKTTNLQYLHESMSPEKKGKLLSLSTDADRTLFFDFMPIHLGKIKGFNIRFQLYTVPGQVRYNATRKLVLKGADAVVFVADSQTAMKDANIESLRNMKENLTANNIKPEDIPVVLQYNKRDLPNIMTVDEINKDINMSGDEIVESAAVNGMGVYETFQLITKRLLRYISKKHNVQIDIPEELETKKTAPTAPAAAPSGGKSDKVKISVPDKSSSLLEEGPGFSETAFEQNILDASMPHEEEEGESAYSGARFETDNFSGSWEPGPLEIEEATPEDQSDAVEISLASPVEDTADLDLDGGESLLEKMLAEEEGRAVSAKAAAPAFDSGALDLDTSGFGEPSAGGADISGLVANLRHEFLAARQKQKELAASLESIEQLINEISSQSG